MADVPLPSVEGPSSADMLTEPPIAFEARRGDSAAPRVTVTSAPSPSVPSTPSTSDSEDEYDHVGQDRRPSPAEQLSRDMQQVHLSSPDQLDMNSVTAAINNITAEQSSTRPPLQVEAPTNGSGDRTSRRSSRGRRSSSRPLAVRHQVTDEEPPQDAFNETGFQDAFRNTKGLMADIVVALESGSLHNDTGSIMHRLRNEAQDLASFNCPSTRTVAFVGGTGAGKSSLLNSLLDFKDLARASTSGAACTCVATEYRYHQSPTLTVQVDLFSVDELTEQLSNMLHAYRQFHFLQQAIDSGEMSNTDPEARDQLQADAQLALDTFRALFRGRLQDETFLLSDLETSVLNNLKSWTVTLLRSEPTAPRPGLTVESCSALLASLSSERPSSNEPSIWPCIRSIKVFLNAHILSKGLVLVDLPGLRDTNAARRNVTERFLRQCNEIFVTCNIDRATTDQGVRDVFDLARPAGLSRVGIICTKSDVIEPTEAVRDYRGERAQAIRRRMTNLDIETRDCSRIDEDIEELASAPTLSIDEQDELNQLSREKFQAAKRREEAEFELKKYIIDVRNKDVTQALIDVYLSSAPTGEVAVFCVSNKLYWDSRDKPSNDALPYLHLSSIMAVRRHCIAIVSTSQHAAATHYMKHKVPALLAEIQLWVQSTAENAGSEMGHELRDALDTIEGWLTGDLMSRRSAAQTVGRAAKRCFDEELYTPRNTLHWSRAAQNAGLKWEQWYHPTYSAFCRNYGIHRTEAAGRCNWNEEIIAGMVQCVSEPWDAVRRTVRAQHGAVVRLIEQLLDRIISHLEVQSDAIGDVVLPFIQALENHLDMAMSSVEEAYMDLEEKLSSLQTDALSGIRTSFIGRAMEGSYRECNFEGGRGSDSRRKAIIRRRLAQERLFTETMSQWRRDFRELADEMQENMTSIIESRITRIQETLDIVRQYDAEVEGDGDAAFRDRVDEALTRAQAAHRGTLRVLS
ncbi:hypothetical protein JDV02_010602 [Purpureocillium takamizusanense]|uniref:Uncharacterized protein n=1 Tax=Purpureocillium takamizusanense TaxID=2060973 RepID=A0A9Q8QQY3_9HYPO|nr:uncharacterized protein JDV02_010602 [Purpureocillium takamizusanense]UNI24883.1 hypothetical protein JDV02_010602 [Purpureocillium takamizusanense]